MYQKPERSKRKKTNKFIVYDRKIFFQQSLSEACLQEVASRPLTSAMAAPRGPRRGDTYANRAVSITRNAKLDISVFLISLVWSYLEHDSIFTALI